MAIVQAGDMKKRHILDLIRYHVEHNEPGFRTAAYAVAKDFRTAGDDDLAFWVEAQLPGNPTWTPQCLPAEPVLFDPFTRLPVDTCPLVLPKAVQKDFMHLVKAVERQAPAHRFLFLGPAGTGKTAAAKMMGRMTERLVYAVDLADTLGETAQETAGNLTRAFADVTTEGLIVVDGLTNLLTNRKTSRPAAAFRKVLNRLHPLTVIVVTADLSADAARDWVPYFDAVVDFDRYTDADRLKAADAILAHQTVLLNYTGKTHPRLLHQLLQLKGSVPAPGVVHSLVRSGLLLSNPDKPADYLRQLFETLTKDHPLSLQYLRDKDFSVRDIEILTGTPKSTVARLTKASSFAKNAAADENVSEAESRSPVLHYKGYTGTVDVDTESDRLCGKVLRLRGLIVYEADTVPQLRKNFQSVVDDYLASGKVTGTIPEKNKASIVTQRDQCMKEF